MPPKKSKKNVEKEKQKIVEDKTFGLKNKKNSKKVQKYVETVKKQVNHKYEGGRKAGSSSAGASGLTNAQRQLMAMRLAELNMMSQPVKDKSKKLTPEEEARRKQEEEEEAERIRIANLPVEDQIEEERLRLTSRTPITLSLFTAWKTGKDIQRKEAKAAQNAAALKGLSKSERARGQGLTGRQLFEAHQNLFVDDEGADSAHLRPLSEYIGGSDDGNEDEEELEDASTGMAVLSVADD
eukprot:IDg8189t1